MDKPECSICDDIFDSDDHRPRVLPCGHGFCTMCIDTSIHRGDTTCAICRKEHGASLSTDLPVSFLLEDFAHKLSVSVSQKYVSEQVHEGHYGMCPKHQEIPLYFKCKSHDIKVCHSCAVIEHPPTTCKLITFEDEIKETKNSQIEALKKQSQVIKNMKIDLHNLNHKTFSEMDLLVTKLEQINKEITEKKESQEKIRDALILCEQKQQTFNMMESNLCFAIGNQVIANQCEIVKTEVLQSQIWEETLKKELNIDQLYAQVESGGVMRSCRVFEENGRVFIPCMSRDVEPPSTARFMKEAELGLNSSTTTVFMDISENGLFLGQVFIRVFGNTKYGKTLIRRVIGIAGLSIKGTNFIKRNCHYVQLEDYMTEDGSQGKLSFASLTENNNEKRPSRGMVFQNGSSFAIWKNEGGRGEGMKWSLHTGTVDSGMDVIDTILSRKDGVTKIIISDCGIVLKS